MTSNQMAGFGVFDFLRLASKGIEIQHFSLGCTAVDKVQALRSIRWPLGSVYEPRIIAQVASRVYQDDKDIQTYKIPINEILGCDPSGRGREFLEKSIGNLFVALRTNENKRSPVTCHLFTKISYHAEEDELEFRISPELKSHFLAFAARVRPGRRRRFALGGRHKGKRPGHTALPLRHKA